MEILLFIAVIAIIIVLCVKSEDKPRIDKDGRFIIRKSEDPETYYRVKAMKEEWERAKKDPCFPCTSYDIPEHIKKEYPYIKRIGTHKKDGFIYWIDLDGKNYTIGIGSPNGFPCSKENMELVKKMYQERLNMEHKKSEEIKNVEEQENKITKNEIEQIFKVFGGGKLILSPDGLFQIEYQFKNKYKDRYNNVILNGDDIFCPKHCKILAKYAFRIFNKEED